MCARSETHGLEDGYLVGVLEWADLNDIYGSAEGLPRLLQTAASEVSWEAPVWQDIWSRLYHQGSVSPASYVALPDLCAIASTRQQVAVDPALFLAAAIVASTDGPPERNDVRAIYAGNLAGLALVAVEKLRLAIRPADFVWALQNVAALEDLSIWQRNLECLANEEVELECPHCCDHVYLEFEGTDLVATLDPDDTAAGLLVTPAAEPDLDAPEARLLALAEQNAQPDIAEQLLQIFGRAACPACGKTFRIGAALV
jgi:hypothetical protein